jgi:DNA polymerase-3 subunit gamma/tau
MLTREAWNALLKVLEEPPPRVVFVFATTEPQKIAQAAAPVLSRLQRFDFRRIGPADVKARLQSVLGDEKIEAEPEALAMIARAADGSMRDALSLTDQALSLGEGALTAERVRDALGSCPRTSISRARSHRRARAGDVFPLMQRARRFRVDFGIFLTGLADMLRAQARSRARVVVRWTCPSARAPRSKRDVIVSPAGDLLRMLTAIGELEQRFREWDSSSSARDAADSICAARPHSRPSRTCLRGLGDGGIRDRGRVVGRRPVMRSSAAQSSSRAPIAALGEQMADPLGRQPIVPSPRIVRDPRSGPAWRPPGDRRNVDDGVRGAAPVGRPRRRDATARSSARAVARAVSGHGTLPTINGAHGTMGRHRRAPCRRLAFCLHRILEQAVPSAISAVGMLTIRVDDVASADGSNGEGGFYSAS